MLEKLGSKVCKKKYLESKVQRCITFECTKTFKHITVLTVFDDTGVIDYIVQLYGSTLDILFL